jgi:hypothetical protein
MKSERAFATFRVAGDKLDPDELTKLLGIHPTLAYAKGQRYSTGPHSPDLKGRTGVWFVSTDHQVQSSRLADHIRWLLDEVEPHKTQLKRFIDQEGLHAVVTCFWHGPSGSKPPVISAQTLKSIESVPAKLEVDFGTDDELPEASLSLHAR